MVNGSGCGSEQDGRSGALARRTVQCHGPVEALAQPSHDRQADAHAALSVFLAAVERVEGTLDLFDRHADAGVADADPVTLDAYVDGADVGMAAGVAQQVA